MADTGQVASHRSPGARLAAPRGAPSQGSGHSRPGSGQAAGSGMLRSAGRDWMLPAGGTQAKPFAPGTPVLAAASGQLSWGPLLREGPSGGLRSQEWQILVCPGAEPRTAGGFCRGPGCDGLSRHRRMPAVEGTALGCPLPRLGALPPAWGPPRHICGAVRTVGHRVCVRGPRW